MKREPNFSLAGALDRMERQQSDINILLNELHRLRGIETDYHDLMRRYRELLDSSVAHGEHMVGGLLKIATTPGVLDAISNANQGNTP